mmetsp:Transcript_40451/g.88399  ORF Transcript_40451/g.88399 Transcript_40451/m.88399 type:complete len:408 (-) Transcript_40451:176-1399(-)
MFAPAATNLSVTVLACFMRWWKTGRMKHQAQLLELYTNPEFEIYARYAQLMTTVYCTMLYSSGMPLLYLFAAAFMLFTYWADKTALLWGSRRPPLYDTEMPKIASQFMLYAAFFHCLLAIPMLGQPCSVPSTNVGGSLASMKDKAGASAGFFSWLSARVGLESTWMFFCVLVILAALWVLWTVLWIIGGTFGQLGKALFLCCCSGRAKILPEMEVGLDTWDTAFDSIELQCPPASYKLERSRDYNALAVFLTNTEGDLLANTEGDPQASGSPPLGLAIDQEAASPDSGLAAAAELEAPPSQPLGLPSGPDLAEAPPAEPASVTTERSSASDARPEVSAPVAEGVARSFLDALRAEYVEGVEGGVGKFFDDVGGVDQERLAPFEEEVRGSASAEETISAIGRRWNLAF